MAKPRMVHTAIVPPDCGTVFPSAFIPSSIWDFRTIVLRTNSEMLIRTPATRPPRMTRPKLMRFIGPPPLSARRWAKHSPVRGAELQTGDCGVGRSLITAVHHDAGSRMRLGRGREQAGRGQGQSERSAPPLRVQPQV